MESEPQVPFRLQSETATDKSTRLRQEELLKWQEFYPENIDEEPPTNKKPRTWWQRGQYS